MSYVDGFVIPVPEGGRAAYLALARRAAPIFAEYGALRLVECWGDDLPDGTVTDFRGSVKAQPGETVVFSWIVWPSKAVRDAAHPRVMQDPRMQMGSDLPFDGARMIFGGFEVILDTGAGT